MPVVKIEVYPHDARWRPEGSWRQVQPWIDVAGIKHQKKAAIRFVRGAADCDHRGLPYRLILVREPHNKHDRNAIAVIGEWQERRWFGRIPTLRRENIGYLPREIAGKIRPELPIAADVRSLYLAKYFWSGWFVNVSMFLLIPSVRSGFWEGREAPNFTPDLDNA